MARIELVTRVEVRCRRCGVGTEARNDEIARNTMKFHSFRRERVVRGEVRMIEESCAAQTSELSFKPYVLTWVQFPYDEETF